jgi:hypothetical protein
VPRQRDVCVRIVERDDLGAQRRHVLKLLREGVGDEVLVDTSASSVFPDVADARDTQRSV